jgi:hypothetical protein
MAAEDSSRRILASSRLGGAGSLSRQWKAAVKAVTLSCSKPCCSTDNRSLAHKNLTVVKAHVGSAGYRTPAQTGAIKRF